MGEGWGVCAPGGWVGPQPPLPSLFRVPFLGGGRGVLIRGSGEWRADPKHVIPPYDAILLLSPKRSNDRALITALQPLIGKIDVEKMRKANLAVSREEQQLSPPAGAARELWKEITGGGSSE